LSSPHDGLMSRNVVREGEQATCNVHTTGLPIC
jgi:hypothetical protein